MYAVLGLSVAWFISCFLTSVFGCHPVQAFWDRSRGKCIDEVKFFMGNGIANLMLDVLVLALPVTMVWRLRMELRQKLALSGIFALGGL